MLQVLPAAGQKATILAMMGRFNAAATSAAEVGFEAGVLGRPSIHVRARTTVRAEQRARHTGWASYQLRSFVEYKAKLAGIPGRDGRSPKQ